MNAGSVSKHLSGNLYPYEYRSERCSRYSRHLHDADPAASPGVSPPDSTRPVVGHCGEVSLEFPILSRVQSLDVIIAGQRCCQSERLYRGETCAEDVGRGL